MHRRRFIYLLSLGTFGIVTTNYLYLNQDNFIYGISNENKMLISEFNKKRIQNLKNNLKEEIRRDFKDNRTIFIGNKIYTYAEIDF